MATLLSLWFAQINEQKCGNNPTSTLQGTITYPQNQGMFESMIFRTSRLVGYVMLVPGGYLRTGCLGLRGLDPFGQTRTWYVCLWLRGWIQPELQWVGMIRFLAYSTRQLPALQTIFGSQQKPGKKGPKYVHTCDSRGYFYIKKGVFPDMQTDWTWAWNCCHVSNWTTKPSK